MFEPVERWLVEWIRARIGDPAADIDVSVALIRYGLDSVSLVALVRALGAFVGGNENRIPYDYHEVLALIAPRPVLVFAPRIDYQATLADVKSCVAEAAKVYQLLGAQENLQFSEIDDYNRFSPESQKVVYAKLKSLAGL